MKELKELFPRAKLKRISYKWHEYLMDKELLLCPNFCNVWSIVGIKNENGLDGLCEYDWNNTPEDEREYETLEELKEDVELGNWAYCLDDSEIEILD